MRSGEEACACLSGGDFQTSFSQSGSQVFREYPELKKHWRKREFWEDGYCVRTVGDAVTAAVVERYIRYHRHEEHEAKQLKLF